MVWWAVVLIEQHSITYCLLFVALQPFVGPWPLFHFLDPILLERGISPSQGIYLYIEQHKHRINSHNTQTSMPWVGFGPTIPAFERAKDSSCLRPRGHCDRLCLLIGGVKSLTGHLSCHRLREFFKLNLMECMCETAYLLDTRFWSALKIICIANFVPSAAVWYIMRFLEYKQLTRIPDELCEHFIDV
jgi:hypothetical protein